MGVLFLIACLFLSLLFDQRIAKGVRSLFSPLERGGLGEQMKRVYEALNTLSQKRSLLWKGLGLSICAHLLVIFSFFFLVRALSLQISIVRLCLVFPLVSTISMLPSLNGLGIREGAFIYFLGGILGKGNAAALSILWLGVLIFLSAIGAIVTLVAGGAVSLKELQEVRS